MTNHAPSLPHRSEIPQASVSETKLVGQAVHEQAPPGSGPVSMGDAPPPLAAATLEADWPTLSTLSRRYIGRALEHTHGNKTRAADMLGIDRRTLNRIMVRDRARKSTPLPSEPGNA